MSLPGRLTGLLLATGVAFSSALALAPAVSASPTPASANGLSFTPAVGRDVSGMFVFVPKPCPAQATNVVAKAVGPGFPAGGQTVISNSTSGISHTAPFILPLQDSFTGFAADNGTSLRGAYVITLQCQNRSGIHIYSSFAGTITFSDATHYTAPMPTKALVAAIAASQNPAASATVAPGAGANSSGQPLADASTAAPGAKGLQSAGPLPKSAQAAKSSSHSSNTWKPILVGVALLLIVLAVFLRIHEVRRDRARALAKESPGSQPKSSPDSQPKSSSMSEPRA